MMTELIAASSEWWIQTLILVYLVWDSFQTRTALFCMASEVDGVNESKIRDKFRIQKFIADLRGR